MCVRNARTAVYSAANMRTSYWKGRGKIYLHYREVFVEI